MKTIVKFGLAALAMGTFIGVSAPVKADQLVWVTAQPVDHFRAVGLMPPGSYAHHENQKPATIALSKAGQGIEKQKQVAPKAAKKGTQHVRSTKRDS